MEVEGGKEQIQDGYDYIDAEAGCITDKTENGILSIVADNLQTLISP